MSVFVFKQKTAYEVRISDWSSDVCSSDLKIASGGELSRFILALKVALAQEGGADTMIFDEIDRGVGGAVASAIGDRLARLSQKNQLLVVTHSPQVAARGRTHMLIAKASTGTVNRNGVLAMGAADRREEDRKSTRLNS